MAAQITLLMDNGSLEPAATLALRGLAVRLSGRLGRPVAHIHIGIGLYLFTFSVIATQFASVWVAGLLNRT